MIILTKSQLTAYLSDPGKMAAKLHEEIAVMKKEVLREAVMLNKRRAMNSSKKPQSKWAANRLAIREYTDRLEERDEEERRMQFYCLNLQQWAVEKHDQKIRDEELKVFQKREAEQKAAEAARLAERARLKLEDAAVLAEDIRLTQEWKEAGRRIGVLAGVNVPVKLSIVDADKGTFKAKKSTTLRIALKEDFDARLLLKVCLG